MSFYPEKIAKRFAGSLREVTNRPVASGCGVGLALECGSVVRFEIRVDDLVVEKASFVSSGCGYLVAATDVLAEWLAGRDLVDLHGLREEDVQDILDQLLGPYPTNRHHCGRVAIESVRSALADLRQRRLNEFQGEEALICTCFGVTENAIVGLIQDRRIASVDAVGTVCRAGTGCGACRPIIEDILGSQAVERVPPQGE